MRLQRWTYFFDGGCRPNPGPIEAAVVTRGETYVRDDLGQGDNNQAEWLALLFAVELAVDQGADDPVFIGDSALVVRQASGEWRCRSPQLEPYLVRWRAATAHFARVRVRQVGRHKNLAGIALDRRHV